MAIALALLAMLCWQITLILAKPGLARMDAVPYGFIRPIFASVLVFFFGLATSSLAIPDPSVLVLKERPSRQAAWGVLLVGAGVAIVSFVA